MGVARLLSFLRRHRRLALDTSVFIYQLESNAKYVALTDPIFSWIQQSGHEAVTSTITMTELLVPSYREGDENSVDSFYALLSTYPNLRWIAPDLEIADTAAKLRAQYSLRTPDALQAATAIQSRATGLVTNDPVFARIAEFDTAVLDRYL